MVAFFHRFQKKEAKLMLVQHLHLKKNNGNNLIERSGVYSYHHDDCRCREGDFFCNRGGHVWSCCGQTGKYSKCKKKFH